MTPAPARARTPAALLEPKPMARCRRVSLYQREVVVRPSPAAVEILFSLARVLSEGQASGAAYVGSTMVTIDLERAAPLVSDACDAASARRLAELAAHDPRALARARALAVEAAEREVGRPLAAPQLDVRVRASGHHLHIDVDLEADLAGGTTR